MAESTLPNVSIERYNSLSPITKSLIVTTKDDTSSKALDSSNNSIDENKERETNNFSDISQTNQPNENREATCTSPMPRRKQARPRRRSDEFGPLEYGVLLNSPEPINTETLDTR